MSSGGYLTKSSYMDVAKKVSPAVRSSDSNCCCCPAHLDPCLPFGTGTNGIAKGDGIQFHLDIFWMKKMAPNTQAFQRIKRTTAPCGLDS